MRAWGLSPCCLGLVDTSSSPDSSCKHHTGEKQRLGLSDIEWGAKVSLGLWLFDPSSSSGSSCKRHTREASMLAPAWNLLMKIHYQGCKLQSPHGSQIPGSQAGWAGQHLVAVLLLLVAVGDGASLLLLAERYPLVGVDGMPRPNHHLHPHQDLKDMKLLQGQQPMPAVLEPEPMGKDASQHISSLCKSQGCDLR